MQQSNFPKEEFFRLTRDLEKYHEIFATLFKITSPRFTDEIDTAAVGFNKSGACIDFMVNPKFWASIDNYTKEFVICHEMSHVALAHGIRQKPFLKIFSPETLNIALDLAVNHLLISTFDFNRFLINNWEELCWVDTVLKDLELEANKSFEYYIQKIQPHCKKIQVKFVDHSYLNQFDGETSDRIKDAANEINRALDKEKLEHVKQNIEEFKSGQGRSTCESSIFTTFVGDDIKYKKIKKWESVLSRAVYAADHERERTQWVRLNRRLTYFGSNLLLPSDMETIDREPYKYKVWLFLDYSGSCQELQQPFFRASNTFDPKKFEVRKFAHCIRVQEFQGKTVSIPGYSTSFSCIERFIQDKITKGEEKKYPDFIFHMTDGYGNDPGAQYPERWHVFLSPNNTARYFENGKYNVFKLQDFIYEKLR